MSLLEREIREISAQAERADAEEDALYGKGKDAHEIPAELRRHSERLKRIDEAKLELEKQARTAREKELRKRAECQRKAAETEPDPVEKKRKRTGGRDRKETGGRDRGDE